MIFFKISKFGQGSKKADVSNWWLTKSCVPQKVEINGGPCSGTFPNWTNSDFLQFGLKTVSLRSKK